MNEFINRNKGTTLPPTETDPLKDVLTYDASGNLVWDNGFATEDYVDTAIDNTTQVALASGIPTQLYITEAGTLSTTKPVGNVTVTYPNVGGTFVYQNFQYTLVNDEIISPNASREMLLWLGLLSNDRTYTIEVELYKNTTNLVDKIAAGRFVFQATTSTQNVTVDLVNPYISTILNVPSGTNIIVRIGLSRSGGGTNNTTIFSTPTSDILSAYTRNGDNNISATRVIDTFQNVVYNQAQINNILDSTLSNHTTNINNPHGVTKTQVGLGNVDNTSDLNKPISTATQAALNAKANLSGAAFTGAITAPTILKTGGTGQSLLLDNGSTMPAPPETVFTPSLEGTTTVGVGTYATRVGRISRIGSHVLISVYIDITYTTMPTGNMLLRGVPINLRNLTDDVLPGGALIPISYLVSTLRGAYVYSYQVNTLGLAVVPQSGSVRTLTSADVDGNRISFHFAQTFFAK